MWRVPLIGLMAPALLLLASTSGFRELARKCRFGPILHVQVGHSFELSRVVRYEREPEGPRMSGDEQVVGADHRPSFLKFRPNVRVVRRGVTGEVQNFHVR